MSAALIAAMFGFTGCGGPDAQKLAELTGDKSFDQVKESYKMSVFNEKPEETEVYAYYLSENEDKVVGFDFDNFALKIEGDYQKAIKEIEDKKEKLTANLEKISLRQLNQELQTLMFMGGKAKPIDDYIAFLKDLKEQKIAQIEADKKAKKEAFEAEMRAEETPAQRKYREDKEELKIKIAKMKAEAAAREAQK